MGHLLIKGKICLSPILNIDVYYDDTIRNVERKPGHSEIRRQETSQAKDKR